MELWPMCPFFLPLPMQRGVPRLPSMGKVALLAVPPASPVFKILSVFYSPKSLQYGHVSCLGV